MDVAELMRSHDLYNMMGAIGLAVMMLSFFAVIWTAAPHGRPTMRAFAASLGLFAAAAVMTGYAVDQRHGITDELRHGVYDTYGIATDSELSVGDLTGSGVLASVNAEGEALSVKLRIENDRLTITKADGSILEAR